YFRTLRGIVIFPVIGSTIAITVSVGESALVPVENGSDTGRRVENGEHVLDMFFRCLAAIDDEHIAVELFEADHRIVAGKGRRQIEKDNRSVTAIAENIDHLGETLAGEK